MINSDTKIQISKGCIDYLIAEIEGNRQRLAIVEAENSVMKRFFNMIDRLGPEQTRGYAEDGLYKVKHEFKKAIDRIAAETEAK